VATLLRLRDVSLTFSRRHRELRLLRSVSVQLSAAELVAVLAQPGQGKSTLLHVAAGMQQPDGGAVFFEGIDVWSQSRRARDRLLADGRICLLENGRPDVDLTVRELVALPLLRVWKRREAYARADDVLRRVDLMECADERWDRLADVERALLMLARAAAREPRLVLLDDLMGCLSLVNSEIVGRLLRSLAEEMGFAVLMSVADIGSTTWCDRTGSLAGGHLQFAPDARIIEFPRPDHARRAVT
jgi:ABC-type cobalamin/Fe3+-siderophores transport system ATPase subunit